MSFGGVLDRPLAFALHSAGSSRSDEGGEMFTQLVVCLAVEAWAVARLIVRLVRSNRRWFRDDLACRHGDRSSGSYRNLWV